MIKLKKQKKKEQPKVAKASSAQYYCSVCTKKKMREKSGELKQKLKL